MTGDQKSKQGCLLSEGVHLVLKVSIQFVFTSQFFLIAFTIKVRDTQARLQIMCAVKRGTVS